MTKVLFISSFPPPTGGVTVLAKQLFDDISQMDDLEVKFVDARKSKIKILLQIFWNFLFLDTITFQISGIFYTNIYLIVFVISRLLKKKIIVRGFGGRLDLHYNNCSKLRKLIIEKTIFKADYFLCETKANQKFFVDNFKLNAVWYPNSRPFFNKSVVVKKNATKFCYFGQLNFSKGIKELYQASEKLPNGTIVDIYGNLGFDIEAEVIDNLEKLYPARYKGHVEHSRVNQIMSNYDVLILPTYYIGEGYPGVIIEAYSLGMPVITTKWKSIPEIVEANCGILIEPQNVQQLVDAILRIYRDNEFYTKLQHGALDQAKKFDSKIWADFFADLCRK